MSVLSDSDCQQQIINTCILIKDKFLSKVKDDELKNVGLILKIVILLSQNIRRFNFLNFKILTSDQWPITKRSSNSAFSL